MGGRETIGIALLSAALVVPIGIVVKSLAETLRSEEVDNCESYSTLDPEFWVADIEYSRPALFTYAATWALVCSLSYIPCIFAILVQLYGMEKGTMALAVCIVGTVVHFCCQFFQVLWRAEQHPKSEIPLTLATYAV